LPIVGTFLIVTDIILLNTVLKSADSNKLLNSLKNLLLSDNLYSGCASMPLLKSQLVVFCLVWLAYAATYLIRKGIKYKNPEATYQGPRFLVPVLYRYRLYRFLAVGVCMLKTGFGQCKPVVSYPDTRWIRN
jgi:hypothetical protein